MYRLYLLRVLEQLENWMKELTISAASFSQKLAVIDEAEFDLTGIEPGVQEYVAPLLAGTVVREMIDSLAHERGHALSVRRYMWQMEY